MAVEYGLLKTHLADPLGYTKDWFWEFETVYGTLSFPKEQPLLSIFNQLGQLSWQLTATAAGSYWFTRHIL